MDDKTKLEILDGIDEFLAGENVLPESDITVKDLKKRWGVGRTAIKRRMDLLVEEGLFTEHSVLNPAGSGGHITVWREVGND